jgi:hypothetical protein
MLRSLWAWIAYRSKRAKPPLVSEQSAVVQRRVTQAMRQSLDETDALREDRSELADRIRRNARAGRGAFSGKTS